MRRSGQKARLTLPLLTLAALLALCLVLVRFVTLGNSPLGKNGAKATVTFTLEVEGEVRAERLAMGGTLTLADGTALGKVEERMQKSPARFECARGDGTLAYPESMARFVLDGSFTAEGSLSKNGFFLRGNRHLTAGSRLSVQLNGLNVTILVLNVSVFSSK